MVEFCHFSHADDCRRPPTAATESHLSAHLLQEAAGGEVPRVTSMQAPAENNTSSGAGAVSGSGGSQGGEPGGAAQVPPQASTLQLANSSPGTGRFAIVQLRSASSQGSSTMVDVHWGSSNRSLKNTCPGIWGIGSCRNIIKFTYMAVS